jgi:uncharacterized protein (TIGR00251 family)
LSADGQNRPPAWRVAGDAVLLSVRLQPRSSRDAIDGIAGLSDGTRSLKARVRALPEKGAANKALIKLLAKALGLARGDLEITSGAKDRNKTVRIAGRPGDIAQLLVERFADTEEANGDD